jgi:hypothetical protein
VQGGKRLYSLYFKARTKQWSKLSAQNSTSSTGNNVCGLLAFWSGVTFVLKKQIQMEVSPVEVAAWFLYLD